MSASVAGPHAIMAVAAIVEQAWDDGDSNGAYNLQNRACCLGSLLSSNL